MAPPAWPRRSGGAAAVAALLLLCGLPYAQARFVVEQGGLKISFPREAAQKFPGGFDMALANFGEPRYGGKLMGRLVYVDREYGMDFTCSPPCRFACQDFGSATPPLDLRRLPGGGGAAEPTWIMLVDRGPVGPGAGEACKFAEKVWNAQRAGAAGVVVANYEDALTTMEAPDDDDEATYHYLQNITVPASFVTRSSGEALKNLLRGAGAKGGADAAAVYVALDWTDALPRKQTVAWEFWTNSNDQCGPVCDVQRAFVRAMAPVAREFGGAGWTTFAPHYIVWTCPEAYRGSAECRSQCIRGGRYCAPDPDGSLAEGYTGAEVVQENLRALCVAKLAAGAAPAAWWDYVTRFAERCTMKKEDYGAPCAEAVFATVLESAAAERNGSAPFAALDDLRRCVGAPDDDAESSIMEDQLRAQRGGEGGGEGEVFILPTVRINGAQYRGALAVADVVRAICAGFLEGNRPAACARASGGEACMPGAAGYVECAARADGKTACVPTVAGHECRCGAGFISHAEPDGSETCLDINECLSITQLDPNCTCARCACKNTWGGYECVTGIPDECAKDHGGCWHGEFAVGSARKTFSACRDGLDDVRAALARGGNATGVPLHTCACPPCFDGSIARRKGQLTCAPKCALDQCEPAVGVCHGGGGISGAAVAGIVAASLAAAAAAAYVGYRLYARGLMEAEVRSIMREYIPLPDGGGGGEGAALRGVGSLASDGAA